MRGRAPAGGSSPLALVRQLIASPAARQRTGTFAIEGIRYLAAAVDARWPVEALVVSERLLRDPLGQKLVRRLRRVRTPCERASPEAFRAISLARRACGVAAVVRACWTPLARADPDAGLCWVAVRRMRSPGNFGAILRSGEAVGAAGVFVLGDGVDPFAPAAVRASTGAVFRQALVRAAPDAVRAWVRQHGVRVVGARASSGRDLDATELPPRTVLVLGEEGEGLGPADRALCDAFARLPVVGQVDSLNVAVAAGVVLYEMLRRRRTESG